MTSLASRTTSFPDLFQFLEGWPFVSFGDRHPFRIEQYRDNGNYVLRAELPGVDPEKDVQVAVEGNELTITAERTVEEHDQTHTEFSYGSFARTVRLPVGADVDKVSASYDAGILTVTVPIAQQADSRQILIKTSKTA